MEQKPTKQYKGVWIPKEIFDNPDLTAVEKMLLAEIDSLDNGEGCFASNEFLGSKFDTSPESMANKISGLRKKGYIVDRSFDGRKRFISTSYHQKHEPSLNETHEPSLNKKVNIENNIENSIKVTKVTQGKALRGDKKVNGILNYWKEKTQLPVSDVKNQRRGASILLKTFSYLEVRALIDIVELAHRDKYATKEAKSLSIMDLARNKQAVMVYGKGKLNNQGGAIHV